MKNKVCSYSREWVEGKGGGTIQTYNETSYKEKRRYERFNASTVLMIKENGGFKVTKTVNLSLGGAKILTEAKLPLAKTLDLVLILGKKANTLRSDVIYSDKANGESPYFYSGLKFKNLDPAEQKGLEEYFLTCRRKEMDN
jgi:c-di-GMP-binding flagellar brake protein YcgR